jgi:pilus assembly protein Flp/PilA
MNMLRNLWNDESGASAAEYALILAIVGTAIAGAAILLGGTIRDAITDASTCISSNGETCAGSDTGGGTPPPAGGTD